METEKHLSISNVRAIKEELKTKANKRFEKLYRLARELEYEIEKCRMETDDELSNKKLIWYDEETKEIKYVQENGKVVVI